MDNQKFIKQISLIFQDNCNDIDWENFLKKYKFINAFGSYTYTVNEKKVFVLNDSLEKILRNVFEGNETQFLQMLNDMVNSHLIQNYIRSSIKKLLDEYELNLIKIFISYSNKNKEEGEKIANFFKILGLDCFISGLNLEVSDNFFERIYSEIEKSNIFLLLLNQNYSNSEWCDQEAGMAFMKYKHNNSLIFPIFMENKIPYGFLSNIQGIKYSETDFLISIGKKIDKEFNTNVFSKEYNLILKTIEENLEILKNEYNIDKIYNIFTVFVKYSLFLKEFHLLKIGNFFDSYNAEDQSFLKINFEKLLQEYPKVLKHFYDKSK